MRLNILLLMVGLTWCNPFIPAVSGEGGPCKDDYDCAVDLACHAGYCEKPVEVDCTVADSSLPGITSQGEDHDHDTWGECYDCDEKNPDVNPGALDIPYNDIDDDCNALTEDSDLDGDGFDALVHGGADCDDLSPLVFPGDVELCNGLVDEEGGLMVPVPHMENVWTDAYEATVFDNPDCTGNRYGENCDDYPPGFAANGQDITTTLYACSLAGSIPSGFMSRFRAESVCKAQAKRLCNGVEYTYACKLGDAPFPYDSYDIVPGVCNDPIGGSSHVVQTGQYSDCSAYGTTYDMSGNLAEWIFDKHDTKPDVGYVAGWGYINKVFVDFGQQSHDYNPGDNDDVEALREALYCRSSNFNSEEFHFDLAMGFFGTRCCKDGPE